MKNRINSNKFAMPYEVLHHLSPSYISDLLTPKSPINNGTLRSSENWYLVQLKARTAFYSLHFTFLAPILWNNLHTALKLALSLKAVRSLLNEYILF